MIDFSLDSIVFHMSIYFFFNQETKKMELHAIQEFSTDISTEEHRLNSEIVSLIEKKRQRILSWKVNFLLIIINS
jgi:hypothetical protein